MLRGERPDQVPWLGDLTYWYHYLAVEKLLPAQHQGPEGLYRLHRDLGVGFYLQGYFPFRQSCPGVVEESVSEGDLSTTTLKTPCGTIRQVWAHLRESYCSAPREHYVKTAADLPALRYWYQNMAYAPDYDEARRRQGPIGESGVTLCYLPKSPLMDLVALHAGIEALTAIWLDAPEELERTLAVMRESNDRAGASPSIRRPRR